MRRVNGFTLLEVMVVIVIIGVLVTITTIAVGALGRDREVEDESRRFAALLTQAKEEAELQGRDVGVMVDRRGYKFYMFEARGQTWRTIKEDDFYSPRELPEDLHIRLWMEGREVELPETSPEDPPEKTADEEQAEEDRGLQPRTEGLGAVDRGPVPQITLLSSGEINQFELRIDREGTDHIWRVLTKTDNTLTAEEYDENRPL
jgi:general secretion pathway protein H